MTIKNPTTMEKAGFDKDLCREIGHFRDRLYLEPVPRCRFPSLLVGFLIGCIVENPRKHTNPWTTMTSKKPTTTEIGSPGTSPN